MIFIAGIKSFGFIRMQFLILKTLQNKEIFNFISFACLDLWSRLLKECHCDSKYEKKKFGWAFFVRDIE